MPRGRPLTPLTLTDEQQDQLNGIARSATLPHALVQRARMILASAEGLNNDSGSPWTAANAGSRGRYRTAGHLHGYAATGADEVASWIHGSPSGSSEGSRHFRYGVARQQASPAPPARRPVTGKRPLGNAWRPRRHPGPAARYV